MEYTRMTEKTERGFYKYKCTKEDKEDCLLMENCGECYGTRVLYRLAELEDKIEKGTLKEVPEGAVVLEREEQQHYAAYKIIKPQIRGCFDRERKLIQVVKNAIENMEVWDEYEHERLLEILGINEEEYTEITGRVFGQDEDDDNEDE